MSVSTQPREEVFPGYQLSERIGSGGYAEVWRARAPGGIEKAVKIVFGCYDDQLAAQEMKAIERIKDVRHPFLLSLERFEVVDGRLAILTELADMSLEQRAQQCRGEGLPGIPREELLRYLSDTAEALDYLAEQHSLLHLDIKPANLLILGGHVKVADFGLVKELATRTQNSMVAGMTPTYSAPEMFDDSPSPQSDQYSLAIVYQEMLTGVLPFPGRTAAQLANQHLRSQPQMAALDERDRPAVARALAKTPGERFPSCRAFVKALIDAASSPVKAEIVPKKPVKAPEKPRGEAKKSRSDAPSAQVPTKQKQAGAPAAAATSPKKVDAAASAVVPQSAATQPTVVHSQEAVDTTPDATWALNLWPQAEIVDVAAPDAGLSVETLQPTLYIAAGGVGIRILSRLRESLAGRAGDWQQSSEVTMLAIDTDREELKEACSNKWSDPLRSQDTVHCSLRLPQDYKSQSRLNLDWLSHRWLYNIPRSLETRGYRALGRLALVDHLDKVVSGIDRKLEQFASGRDSESAAELRVVVLGGIGGGTAGGMAIDLANAVRSRVQRTGKRAHVEGLFICTCLGGAAAAPLAVANTYAFLSELQFVSLFGNEAPESAAIAALESSEPPFDSIYCVPLKHRTSPGSDDGIAAIANQLLLSATHGPAQMLQALRQTQTPREIDGHDPYVIRTFGAATLAGYEQQRIERLAAILAQTVERDWLADAGETQWQRLEPSSEAETPREAPGAGGEPGGTSNIAAALSKHQPEEWRHRFAEHAATRFAFEAVSRICQESALRGAYRTTFLSSKDPAAFTAIASQVTAAINKLLELSPETDPPPREDEPLIFENLTAASHRVITRLLDEIEQSTDEKPFIVDRTQQIITAECAAIIEERSSRRSTSGVREPSAAIQSDVEQALERANVDLLQCGCDRRTMIVVPRREAASEAVAALAQARPTAAVIIADVEQCVVYCEGSGIKPSALTRGFQRIYPGIAEAAARHHTRTDIDWSDKPA